MHWLVGNIVLKDSWAFPCKVVGEWPGGGLKVRGFSNTGHSPNAVYSPGELQVLSAEEFDSYGQNDIECLIKMRDKW